MLRGRLRHAVPHAACLLSYRWLCTESSSAAIGRLVALRGRNRMEKTPTGNEKELEKEEKSKRGFYQDAEKKREFFEELAGEMGVEQADDWLHVTVRDVLEAGGSRILSQYKYSVRKAVQDVMPDVKFSEEARRGRGRERPSGYWKKRERRREFFEMLKKKMEVRSVSEWRKVQNKHVDQERGGEALLRLYSRSLSAALKDTYPEMDLSEHQVRPKVPVSYWTSLANRRRFFDQMKEEEDIRLPSQWLGVTQSLVQERGGAGLLKAYGQSVLDAVKATYPEDEAIGRLVPLAEMTAGQFLRLYGEENGISKPEMWADVTERQVIAAGGGRFLKGVSLQELLAVTFPGEAWDALVCRPRVPSEYWKSTENVREFLEQVREKLRIREKSDWYRVSREQLRSMRGLGLLREMSLIEALRVTYTDETWDEDEWRKMHKKSAQRDLLLTVEDLFPGAAVMEDYRQADGLKGADGHVLELDIYVPEHQLAFEYHGRQHYDEIPFFGPLDVTQRRDRRKRELCEENGIRLVEVPYWWDESHASLIASILEKYPSLLPAITERKAAA